MSTEPKKRNVLMYLAAEGVVPVLGGCAGALIAGPQGGIVGLVVGQAVEKAINLFGKGIVEKWHAWFAAATPEERAAAVAELAALPPADARAEARDVLSELAPDARPEDLAVALDYLSVLPRSVDRALVPEPGGQKSMPATITFHDPQALLPLLPQDVPPYPASADLPGTPYKLLELLGSGGFGAVYRAVSPTLQHLPLAIKFCLDRSLIAALNLERSNLERLMRAAGDRGAAHVVRLYGYDLDHATPYLVYEYVPGGDLTQYLAAKRTSLGRGLTAGEVLGIVTQIAHGLAFAHAAGLVHRDVKPANVLADGDQLKLADFGLGGVAVRRAVQQSRIGTTTIDYLTLAEQASLFRGAGTPLYMSPEQRRGANPDRRHDLYSLGVLWFQLLAGDVSRELHPGWAKELTVRYGVPPSHIALIDRCVGWFDERPKDAGELIPLLREAEGHDSPPAALREPPPLPAARPETLRVQETPATAPRTAIRKERLLDLLRELAVALADPGKPQLKTIGIAAGVCFSLVGLITLTITASDRGVRGGYGGLQIGYSVAETIGTVLAAGLPITAVVTGGFYLWLRFYTFWRKEGAVGRCLQALIREFPAEVEAWGGLSELSSPRVVGAVIDQVSRPTFMVSASRPPAPGPARGPIPVAAVRKEALLTQLRKLRSALTPPPRGNTWEQAPILFGVAVLTLIVTAATMAPIAHGQPDAVEIPMVLIPTVVLTVLVPWGLSYWLAANARRRYEDRVGRMAAGVRTAFRGDVDAWGDAGQLTDPAFLDAALRRVQSPEYEVSPPADPDDPLPEPPEDKTRTAPRLWLAIPMSLAFAVTLGVAVGLPIYWAFAPSAHMVYVPSKPYSDTYYFAPGGALIDVSQFRSKENFAAATAAVAGIGCGIAGLVAAIRGLTRRIRFLRPTMLALAAGYFLLALPAVVGGRLLVEGLIGPHRSSVTVGQWVETQFATSGGSRIDLAEYVRLEWRARAVGHALGLVLGLALPTGLVVLVRQRCQKAADDHPAAAG
ncbi:MAG TPA: serine/threonine-protein kinase [Gemmataceae bacterium]|nr:serine/threonine-protein kinase [Gemmataceae bacterium]